MKTATRKYEPVSLNCLIQNTTQNFSHFNQMQRHDGRADRFTKFTKNQKNALCRCWGHYLLGLLKNNICLFLMPNNRLVFAEKLNFLKRRTSQNASKMADKPCTGSPQYPHKHLHKTELTSKNRLRFLIQREQM